MQVNVRAPTNLTATARWIIAIAEIDGSIILTSRSEKPLFLPLISSPVRRASLWMRPLLQFPWRSAGPVRSLGRPFAWDRV